MLEKSSIQPMKSQFKVILTMFTIPCNDTYKRSEISTTDSQPFDSESCRTRLCRFYILLPLVCHLGRVNGRFRIDRWVLVSEVGKSDIPDLSKKNCRRFECCFPLINLVLSARKNKLCLKIEKSSHTNI